MRRAGYAAVIVGATMMFAGGGHAQQYGGPQLVQGMGPAQGAGGIDPRWHPREEADHERQRSGGLFGLIFDGGERRYVARYNGPTQAAPAYPYQPQPAAYGYQPQTGYTYQPAYSYAPQPADRPRHIVDPRYVRQDVDYNGGQAPGTIVIDSSDKFLYLVEGHGRALRYGIGVGRPGFLWSGLKTITRKSEWPAWTPPAEMLLRRPDLPAHMEGGPANPLGARAMYLGSSLYRIHGTNEPDTIGTNVSSGCIRLINEDVIDLFDRVHVGTKVVVM